MGVVIQTFVGDNAPPETFYLTRPDRSRINLTGATVWLLIEEPDTGLLTNNPNNGHHNICQITDAVNGVVTYAWNSTDCPDPGIYRGNFKIKYSDGTIETFGILISAQLPLALIS